jgi:hypothetical protein
MTFLLRSRVSSGKGRPETTPWVSFPATRGRSLPPFSPVGRPTITPRGSGAVEGTGTGLAGQPRVRQLEPATRREPGWGSDPTLPGLMRRGSQLPPDRGSREARGEENEREKRSSGIDEDPLPMDVIRAIVSPPGGRSYAGVEVGRRAGMDGPVELPPSSFGARPPCRPEVVFCPAFPSRGRPVSFFLRLVNHQRRIRTRSGA